jgi:hypothetical protein
MGQVRHILTPEELQRIGFPSPGSPSQEDRRPTQDDGRVILTPEQLRRAGFGPPLDPSEESGQAAEIDELSALESAIATGIRVVPAVGGSLLGAFGGPAGVLAGGSLGAMLGEGFAQRYEQEKTGQEFDPNLAQVGIAGVSGAIPWGSAARVGSGALRATLPRLAQRLPSMRAAPTGVLERLRHQPIREIAKGASAGAPIAAIEGGASRYFQDQEVWDPEAIQRDLTMGALFGGAVPAAGALGTKAVGIAAPSRERGLGAWAHRYSTRHDANIELKDARARAEGWPETEPTGVTASKLGVGGTIDNQLDELEALYRQTDANLTEMVNQPGVRYVKISDVKGVEDSLRLAIKRRKKVPGQDAISDRKELRRLLNQSIVGDQIHVKDAIKLKRILDNELPSNAFAGKLSEAEDEALKKISNRFRTDIKSQMKTEDGVTPIADILDFQKRIIDLKTALSEYTGSVTIEDLISHGGMGSVGIGGLAGFAAFGGGPLGVAAGAGLGAAARIGIKSPRVRSRFGNAVNWAAGNRRDVVPPVMDLPRGDPPPPSSRWSSGEYRGPGGSSTSWTNPPPPPPGGGRQRSSRRRPPPPPGGRRGPWTESERESWGRRPPPPPPGGGRQGSSRRRTAPPPGGERQGPSSRPQGRTMPRTKSQAYTVLGVSPDATADQVKKAWRDLSRKHHPDAIPPPKTTGTMKDIMGDEKAMAEYMAKMAKYKALQQEATDRMQEINAAWDLLKK